MNKQSIIYSFRFLTLYCIFYFGTQAIIGLAAQGGYYVEWVDKYLNYPALIRRLLLNASKFGTQLMGYPAENDGIYKIRIVNGRGVKVVYTCLGIGLFSFWSAFIIANCTCVKRKALFIVSGIAGIFILNVSRIVLLLIASNENYKTPFGIEHHTMFNIVTYCFIILMIVVFDRSERRLRKESA